jgi:hypothetical protein
MKRELRLWKKILTNASYATLILFLTGVVYSINVALVVDMMEGQRRRTLTVALFVEAGLFAMIQMLCLLVYYAALKALASFCMILTEMVLILLKEIYTTVNSISMKFLNNGYKLSPPFLRIYLNTLKSRIMRRLREIPYIGRLTILIERRFTPSVDPSQLTNLNLKSNPYAGLNSARSTPLNTKQKTASLWETFENLEKNGGQLDTNSLKSEPLHRRRILSDMYANSTYLPKGLSGKQDMPRTVME